ncbi:MAG: DNA-binding response regulator [Ignavibacteriae bacterium HGW-Ignavibacteriae-2]|jgi:DNA-binding NarL/FixJ family response regulator|nr:response regulator transcription factor [Bacteroidota bacterium]PKL88279.1 MAG: DNA-binding response regulator [Ignavibacteriae bacterium HGW-Ignavibacteriae-2]
MKIKVALAEDNDKLAGSIKEKLELFSDRIEFKFRAKNGGEMIRKLETVGDVDAVLMDIEMPVMDGIETTNFIKNKYSEIKVIMLTVFDDEDKIFRSIQAGANGYLLKDEPPDKIVEGIEMIMDGGAPMSPVIAVKTLSLLRKSEIVIPNILAEDFSLSKREVEVLELLSKGEDYVKISNKLFISPATVRKHIENIYKKLEVHNKIQAVQKAQKHNII